MQKYTGAIGVAVVALLGWAVEATAQWVEAPGQGWVQIAAFHHDTRTVFDEDGQRERIFADGHAVTTSLYVTVALGVVRGVDAWVQAPLHQLQYNDAATNRSRAGLGDVRLYLRAAPEAFGITAPFPIALRAGIKLPGGDFPVDAEVIPLGEGQRDMEAMLEVGQSFYPRSLYAHGWLGYRARSANTEAARAPGDEAFGFFTIGGSVQRIGWRMIAEGYLNVQDPTIQGIAVPSARRQALTVQPTLSYPIGRGAVEVGIRTTLAGQNVPAGVAFTLGYFHRF
ncbi:MAG: transporter [Bacteroidota bacterium]